MVRGDGRPHWTGKIALYPENLDQPLRWKRPRMIFVNSLSDLFHEGVPDEYIDRVFAVMFAASRHGFQVLTKCADRMAEYFSPDNPRYTARKIVDAAAGMGISDPIFDCDIHFPLRNVWLGVSTEDQERADERIPHLLRTPAAVRFVSAEPLLGPIDLTSIRFPNLAGMTEDWDALEDHGGDEPVLNWIIVGGESGPGARPCDVSWIRSIKNQCQAAGVACFVKQLGANPVTGCDLSDMWRGVQLRDRKGGDPEEWPADFRVREFPAGANLAMEL